MTVIEHCDELLACLRLFEADIKAIRKIAEGSEVGHQCPSFKLIENNAYKRGYNNGYTKGRRGDSGSGRKNYLTRAMK